MTDEVSAKERPMLFGATMVRALLEGRKTQTRRIFKLPKALASCCPSPHRVHVPHNGSDAVFAHCYMRVDCCEACDSTGARLLCPYGALGDHLWVRETFSHQPHLNAKAYYRATDPLVDVKWKPSIFMPRSASRITLEITAVRVERLQDITEEDARAEGCAYEVPSFGSWAAGCQPMPAEWYALPEDEKWLPRWFPNGSDQMKGRQRRINYISLWESIHGPGSWDQNPWVWVIAFKRVD